MKIKSKLINAIFLGLFGFSIILAPGCGDDDPVQGCTDQDAENYDASAEEDDQSCVYARDKFLGDYLGTLMCMVPQIAAAINNDALPFEIVEGVTNDKSQVLINLQGSVPVSFSATAEGNTLTIDTELPGLPLDLTGDEIPESVDLVVTGSAVIDGNTLTGSINMVASTMLPTDPPTPLSVPDSCAITGTKS